MQIDRSRANRAASGQRYIGFTEAGDQRSQYEDRCAHRFDQIIGCAALGDRAAVDFNIEFFIKCCLGTHTLQQGNHRRDVLEVRHIPDRDRFSRQQGAGEDWQRRVLRARNRDHALERRTTFDEQLIHVLTAGAVAKGGELGEKSQQISGFFGSTGH